MILFFQNETALKMTAAVPVGKTMTICKHCGKDIEDPRTTTCIKDYIEYQDVTLLRSLWRCVAGDGNIDVSYVKTKRGVQ